MSEARTELTSAAYAEVLSRLVRLRDLAGELAAAYDDPIASQGAEEMRISIERVLELFGHRE